MIAANCFTFYTHFVQIPWYHMAALHHLISSHEWFNNSTSSTALEKGFSNLLTLRTQCNLVCCNAQRWITKKWSDAQKICSQGVSGLLLSVLCFHENAILQCKLKLAPERWRESSYKSSGARICSQQLSGPVTVCLLCTTSRLIDLWVCVCFSTR